MLIFHIFETLLSFRPGHQQRVHSATWAHIILAKRTCYRLEASLLFNPREKRDQIKQTAVGIDHDEYLANRMANGAADITISKNRWRLESCVRKWLERDCNARLRDLMLPQQMSNGNAILPIVSRRRAPGSSPKAPSRPGSARFAYSPTSSPRCHADAARDDVGGIGGR